MADTGIARWLGVLGSPDEGQVLLGPNWFASVMGTGIVAVAGATLPFSVPLWLTGTAWLLACLLLVLLLVIVPFNWLRHPGHFSALTRDPVAIQFFGAPPMALMTVGSSTLLVGSHWLGESLATDIAWACWILGTLGGYAAAVVVPYRLFTALEVRSDGAFGGWLMPVVPPMVSAALGALLVPHAPEGALRETLVYVCFACFGMSLVTAMIIISLIWSRLTYFGSSGSARVATLWIVLGPVGQSITVAGALGTAAPLALPDELDAGFRLFAVMYGVPMFGFVLLWIPLAAALTWRARQRNMGFALTWWSFTFPVGTCVTGTSQLARHTGLPAFEWIALVLYGALLLAWITVGANTFRYSRTGNLLTPPTLSPQPPARKG
jgi:tellurite resistance protein TehA-like permease